MRALRPHIRTQCVDRERDSLFHLHFPWRLEIDLSDMTSPRITIYSSAICPYCVAAKNFLKSKGLDWTEVRIDTDPGERQRMVALAKRTSVPQIFVGNVHVGGYDDMMAMHRAGEFEPLLAGQGA
jgi:glutaredoxin 3